MVGVQILAREMKGKSYRDVLIFPEASLPTPYSCRRPPSFLHSASALGVFQLQNGNFYFLLFLSLLLHILNKNVNTSCLFSLVSPFFFEVSVLPHHAAASQPLLLTHLLSWSLKGTRFSPFLLSSFFLPAAAGIYNFLS